MSPLSLRREHNRILSEPGLHRYMTYNHGDHRPDAPSRHYVECYGTKPGFAQVSKIGNLTTVSKAFFVPGSLVLYWFSGVGMVPGSQGHATVSAWAFQWVMAEAWIVGPFLLVQQPWLDTKNHFQECLVLC